MFPILVFIPQISRLNIENDNENGPSLFYGHFLVVIGGHTLTSHKESITGRYLIIIWVSLQRWIIRGDRGPLGLPFSKKFLVDYIWNH